MGAGAAAQLALEFGVGERFVAGDVLGLERVAVVDDDAGARREGKPGVGAQVRRNTAFQHFRFHRREEAERVGNGQPGSIDGDENVRRAVGALVADALHQLVLLAVDTVDLDAGLLREVLVELLVGLVMAGGIEVEDFLLRHRRQGGDEGEQGKGKAGFHCGLRWRGIGCGEPGKVAKTGRSRTAAHNLPQGIRTCIRRSG